MFEDVIRQALKDKNPSAYNKMRTVGTLDQYVQELGELSADAYRTIAGNNPTPNSQATARELVIADIVAEVQKPPESTYTGSHMPINEPDEPRMAQDDEAASADRFCDLFFSQPDPLVERRRKPAWAKPAGEAATPDTGLPGSP